MFYTTLNKIRACSPCQTGWEKLLAHLGKTKADDELLPFSVILKSNGLYDALWCCRAAPEYAREWRLYAVWCARQAQHLMTDKRRTEALDISEPYANGLATEEELAAAGAAVKDAAWDAAWYAAMAATRAAAAWDAAKDAQAEEFKRVIGEDQTMKAKGDNNK